MTFHLEWLHSSTIQYNYSTNTTRIQVQVQVQSSIVEFYGCVSYLVGIQWFNRVFGVDYYEIIRILVMVFMSQKRNEHNERTNEQFD